MNHRRRDRAAGRRWCARMSRSSPRSRRCISDSSATLEEIADAKAEIFDGLEPGGAAVLNRDNARYRAACGEHARRQPASQRIVYGFGEHARSTLQADQMRAACRPFRHRRQDRRPRYDRYVSERPAGIWCRTRWRCWAAAHLVGADLAQGAAGAGRSCAPSAGRGKRHVLRRSQAADHADRRELQRQSGVDGGGAGAARRDARRASGRRIAVLGDMLELGDRSGRSCTRLSADLIDGTGRRPVFCCGPQMRALAEALPASAEAATAPASRS